MDYEHVQYGYLSVFVIPFYIGIIAIFLADDASPFVAVLAALGVMVLTLALIALFSRLTVTVASGQVTAAFGVGWPRRSVSLTEVVTARQVRNRWYFGWGIRKVPKGWMYNVWGLDAVDLELKNGKVFRIGTNDPDGLQTAVLLQRKS